MATSLGGFAHIRNQSGTSATTPAFSVDPVAGSTISVAVSWNGLVTVSSVTDNAGNTYVAAGASVGDGNKRHQIWYAKNCLTTTGFTVTFTTSASATQMGISAVEVKGADTTNPLGLYGGQQQNPGITTTDGTTTGNLGTPSEDGHFIHGCSTSNAASDNYNAGTGFTQISNSGVGNYRIVAEYQIQTTAAPVAATFTQDWTATTTTVGATYKPLIIPRPGVPSTLSIFGTTPTVLSSGGASPCIIQ